MVEPDRQQTERNKKRWQSSLRGKRREEVILTRLRIGHTRLTHS